LATQGEITEGARFRWMRSPPSPTAASGWDALRGLSLPAQVTQSLLREGRSTPRAGPWKKNPGCPGGRRTSPSQDGGCAPIASHRRSPSRSAGPRVGRPEPGTADPTWRARGGLHRLRSCVVWFLGAALGRGELGHAGGGSLLLPSGRSLVAQRGTTGPRRVRGSRLGSPKLRRGSLVADGAFLWDAGRAVRASSRAGLLRKILRGQPCAHGCFGRVRIVPVDPCPGKRARGAPGCP
jgi:hypothetical protein